MAATQTTLHTPTVEQLNSRTSKTDRFSLWDESNLTERLTPERLHPVVAVLLSELSLQLRWRCATMTASQISVATARGMTPHAGKRQLNSEIIVAAMAFHPTLKFVIWDGGKSEMFLTG